MTTRQLGSMALTMLLLCTASASVAAQEGHPMTGTWVGEWGPPSARRTRVVMVMKWTGKELAGSINPGPRAIPFRTATVNPDDWTVRIEADASDAQGRAVTYVIQGKLGRLGSYNRELSGTWHVDQVKNEFTLYRQ